jgi:hypothetical protein
MIGSTKRIVPQTSFEQLIRYLLQFIQRALLPGDATFYFRSVIKKQDDEKDTDHFAGIISAGFRRTNWRPS